MPELITLEGRKSDTLWRLASAALSMGFSIYSPNISDVDRALVDMNEYMTHDVRNTQGM
jgi:hypothetical protein